MKRFFPIFLTLMLILTLAIAGCGGGDSGGGDPSVGTLTGYVSYFRTTPTTEDINAINVQIKVTTNDDTLIASTYTDASGNYFISNIPVGDYIVKADFHFVTNSPPAPYTATNGGSFYFNNAWASAWGWSIGGTYNNTVIGTAPTPPENLISISNGTNTTIKFRLQVEEAP